MQILNACGFAEYKSFIDTQSVFLGDEFSLIFSRFPCFLAKRKTFVEVELTCKQSQANLLPALVYLPTFNKTDIDLEECKAGILGIRCRGI